MDWSLIGRISGFGAIMGVATTLGWIQGWEGLLWAVVGAASAVWIARKAPGRYFLHGLAAGAIGGSLAPLIQAVFYGTYAASHPQTAGQMSRMLLLALLPVAAAMRGITLGALAWAASRLNVSGPRLW